MGILSLSVTCHEKIPAKKFASLTCIPSSSLISFFKAIGNLIKLGVIVNNQTILLNGVNDSADTLTNLPNGLVSIGAHPYNIFQCRLVRRFKRNFQVPLCRGIEIIEKAMERCNGHFKCFKYIMSHKTGKTEILGLVEVLMYFKYHQAKNRINLGKIFQRKVDYRAGWLDDLI